MTDQDLLILILVVIYLSECVSWVPITDYVAQFSRLRKGTFHRPGQGLGNDRGRFLFSRVLPFRAGTLTTPQTAGSFDLTAAEQRWQEYQSISRLVAWGSNTTFLLLFLVLPLVWRNLGGESLVLLMAFFLTLVSGLVTGIVHFRAHRKLFPDQRDERWKQACLIAVLPTHACRAHDQLGRQLFREFHPLVLAWLALPQAPFAKCAGRFLRHAVHPLAAGDAPENLPALRQFLDDRGFQLKPPVSAGEATQYCPRCETLFGPTASRCDDCGGLALERC